LKPVHHVFDPFPRNIGVRNGSASINVGSNLILVMKCEDKVWPPAFLKGLVGAGRSLHSPTDPL